MTDCTVADLAADRTVVVASYGATRNVAHLPADDDADPRCATTTRCKSWVCKEPTVLDADLPVCQKCTADASDPGPVAGGGGRKPADVLREHGFTDAEVSH